MKTALLLEESKTNEEGVLPHRAAASPANPAATAACPPHQGTAAGAPTRVRRSPRPEANKSNSPSVRPQDSGCVHPTNKRPVGLETSANINALDAAQSLVLSSLTLDVPEHLLPSRPVYTSISVINDSCFEHQRSHSIAVGFCLASCTLKRSSGEAPTSKRHSTSQTKEPNKQQEPHPRGPTARLTLTLTRLATSLQA